MATQVHLQRGISEVRQLSNGRIRVFSKSSDDALAPQLELPDTTKPATSPTTLREENHSGQQLQHSQRQLPESIEHQRVETGLAAKYDSTNFKSSIPFNSSRQQRPGKWELLTATAPKPDYTFVPPAAAKYFLW
jgi:hypothetical protein